MTWEFAVGVIAGASAIQVLLGIENLLVNKKIVKIHQEGRDSADKHWANVNRLIDEKVTAKFMDWPVEQLVKAKEFDMKMAEAQVQLYREERLNMEAEITKLQTEVRLKDAENKKLELLAKMQEKRSE